MNQRYDLKIMGRTIGTCESFVYDDMNSTMGTIVTSFVANVEFNAIPSGELFIDFLTGKWQKYDDEGKVVNSGFVFPSISEPKV